MLRKLETELLKNRRSSEEILRDFFKIKNLTGRAEELLDGILRNLGFKKGEDGLWSYEPVIPRDEFVVVDVETTGLSFEKGARIIEIGMVEVKRGEIVRTYSQLINPGVRIPPKITSITGINNEKLLGKPSFEEVAPDILDFISNRYMVAHNFPFDYSFLKGEFARIGVEFPQRGICTLQISRKLLGLRRNDLDSLASYFNLSFISRHRALGDALVTAEVFLRLQEIVPGDIIEFCENECRF